MVAIKFFKGSYLFCLLFLFFAGGGRGGGGVGLLGASKLLQMLKLQHIKMERKCHLDIVMSLTAQDF